MDHHSYNCGSNNDGCHHHNDKTILLRKSSSYKYLQQVEIRLSSWRRRNDNNNKNHMSCCCYSFTKQQQNQQSQRRRRSCSSSRHRCSGVIIFLMIHLILVVVFIIIPTPDLIPILSHATASSKATYVTWGFVPSSSRTHQSMSSSKQKDNVLIRRDDEFEIITPTTTSTTSTALLQKKKPIAQTKYYNDEPTLLVASNTFKENSEDNNDVVIDDLMTSNNGRISYYNNDDNNENGRHTRSVFEAMRDPLVVVDHYNDNSNHNGSSSTSSLLSSRNTPKRRNNNNNNSKKDWRRRHAKSVLEGIRDISINPNDVRQVTLSPVSTTSLNGSSNRSNINNIKGSTKQEHKHINGASPVGGSINGDSSNTIGKKSTPYFATDVAVTNSIGSDSSEKQEGGLMMDDDLPVLPATTVSSIPPPMANGIPQEKKESSSRSSSSTSTNNEDESTSATTNSVGFFKFPWVQQDKVVIQEDNIEQTKRRQAEEGGLFGTSTFKFLWDKSKNDFDERQQKEIDATTSAAKDDRRQDGPSFFKQWKMPWDNNNSKQKDVIVDESLDESWKERVKWLSVPNLFRDIEVEADIIASQVITKTSDIMSRGLIDNEFDNEEHNITTTTTTTKSVLASTLRNSTTSSDEYDLLRQNKQEQSDDESPSSTRLSSDLKSIKKSRNLFRRIKSLFRSRKQQRQEQQQEGDETATIINTNDIQQKKKRYKKRPRFRSRANMERKFAARTVAGLIAALAEDAEDLRVEVLSSKESPMWNKIVDEVHISFTKLKFAPLKMRGPPLLPVVDNEETTASKKSSLQKLSNSLRGWEQNLDTFEKKDLTKNLEMELDNETSSSSRTTSELSASPYHKNGGKLDHESNSRNKKKTVSLPLSPYDTSTEIEQDQEEELSLAATNTKPTATKSSSLPTADDMFDQMDVDNSGALDQDELFEALNLAMGEHEDTSVLVGGGDENHEETTTMSSSNTETKPKPRRRRRRSLWSRSRTDAVLERLAARLIKLYDTNGDGVVDRDEYRLMVADMAKLRRTRRRQQLIDITRKNRRKYTKRKSSTTSSSTVASNSSTTTIEKGVLLEEDAIAADTGGGGFAKAFGRFVSSRFTSRKATSSAEEEEEEDGTTNTDNNGEDVVTGEYDSVNDDNDDDDSTSLEILEVDHGENLEDAHSVRINYNDPVITGTESGEGSIVLENLKLDLRRLFFGAIPVVKHIVPGGPLVLEPFTIKLCTSFNENDFKNSRLLEEGLKRLVARALRRRVRDIRDVIDGAVFFGRTWTMASREAPQVGFPTIENIEFDNKDRIIISGRAKIRSSPGAPEIENAFKLRTKFASGENGRRIRLDEPEIALIVECPKAWERNIVYSCKKLGLKIPRKPRPIYTYIPLASKLKVKDTDGFDLGQDNCLKRIQIRNKSLEIEMSSILRPGRFLGNHYLAFSVPNRTFIITLDRVKEGIRAARQAKEILKLQRKERALIARGELDPTDAQYVVIKSDKQMEDELLKFDDTPPTIERKGPSRYGGEVNGKKSTQQQPQQQQQQAAITTTTTTTTTTNNNLPTKKKKTNSTAQQQRTTSSLAKTMIVKRENVFSRFIRGYMSASQDFEDLLLEDGFEQRKELSNDKTSSTMKKKSNKQRRRRGRKSIKQLNEDEWNDRLTSALSEWFGRQDMSIDNKRLTLRDFEENDESAFLSTVAAVDEEEEEDIIQRNIEQNLAKETFEKILPTDVVDVDPSKEVIVINGEMNISGSNNGLKTRSDRNNTDKTTTNSNSRYIVDLYKREYMH